MSGRTIRLSDGNMMPCIGFGVYQSRTPLQSIEAAFEAGFRYIDTARTYHNEDFVGQAVRNAIQGSLSRSDIFVTSKVNARSHWPKAVAKAVRQTLSRAGEGIAYIDLYLLHDAISGPERRTQAYIDLLAARKLGQVRSVGVSNWSVQHLEGLREAGLEAPAVNQIELHPWCQQRPVVEYCRMNGIAVQAYCPLARGRYLGHKILAEIAQQTLRTPAQVLLKWSIQHRFCPVVKSDTLERIVENYALFDWELNDEQMQSLDALDMGKQGAVSWNPIDVP